MPSTPKEKEATSAEPSRINHDNAPSGSQGVPRPAIYNHLPGRLSAEDPPTYVRDEGNLHDQIHELMGAIHAPIDEYPSPQIPVYRRNEEVSETDRRSQDIVRMFFDALTTKKDEIVAVMIESGIVTTETTNQYGRTPLLAAIEAGNIRTVQQLMDFDANVNALGIMRGMPPPYYSSRKKQKRDITWRTPLMVAAEKGNLTIVKLLMETYGADDSMIAPDGELALRIASSNGHREIVNYLPLRRGGGFRRWKTGHRKGMMRVKRAVKSIVWFLRLILYETPKFLLCTMPKYLLVLPIKDGAKWLYKHREELPRRVVLALKRSLKWLGNFLKNLPKATLEFVKGLAEFIWKGIKNFPTALKTFLTWIWNGIKRAAIAVSDIFTRLVSFLHTAFAAIITLFRNITLKDVRDGFVAFLRAIIVDGPKKLWEWICKFEEMTLRMFEALWGCLGWIMWMILRGIVELLIYVPKKLWEILAGCGMSVVGAVKELLIWINPKRH
ncbi:ankyrin [Lophiostoma macrostomum CBS 122681]|uniref:Ankyrin n=1 Tax=Lophiostoma macrostomum CBS 122681 TaxID=1314788 RepID=A0A6A6SUN9_9PLEO|nr:ankyrin [Lophiostoma macrostomum CBS 122681]